MTESLRPRLRGFVVGPTLREMMLALVRNVLVVLALLGVFGQTTARAMPMEFFAAAAAPSAHDAAPMTGCAEMNGEAATGEDRQPGGPCDGMTLDCIGKMGCASALVLPTRLPHSGVAVQYHPVAYVVGDERRAGRSVSPELFPPIRAS